jgi:hypothetical protein
MGIAPGITTVGKRASSFLTTRDGVGAELFLHTPAVHLPHHLGLGLIDDTCCGVVAVLRIYV